MKLRPVITKLDKGNKATSKKNLTMKSCRQIVTSFPIYGQFTITIAFYLTKPENRTKKSLTHLSYYCFE